MREFGFMLFAFQHNFILATNRKNITDNMAEIFVKRALLKKGRYAAWQNATEKERQETIKNTKWRIQPVSFEIKGNTAGKYLSYSILKHAQDDSATRGGGTIPESYWADELTIFSEEDLVKDIQDYFAYYN